MAKVGKSGIRNVFSLRLLETLGRAYVNIPRSENYKIRITSSPKHLQVMTVYKAWGQ